MLGLVQSNGALRLFGLHLWVDQTWPGEWLFVGYSVLNDKLGQAMVNEGKQHLLFFSAKICLETRENLAKC